jgi:hypothetical protein
MENQVDGGKRIEQLTEKVRALIEEHFERGADHLHLSALGARLGEDRVELEKLAGTKLSNFVRDHLPYKIEVSGEHKNILYLVSPDKPSVDGLHPGPAHMPWFMPGFWAAFANPLAPGEERYLDLKSLRSASDPKALETGVSGTDVLRIDPTFIASSARAAPSETVARIRAWLDEQKLPAERFVEKRGRQARARSILHLLIEALEPEAQRRVSLPLDVVKTLLEQRR